MWRTAVLCTEAAMITTYPADIHFQRHRPLPTQQQRVPAIRAETREHAIPLKPVYTDVTALMDTGM